DELTRKGNAAFPESMTSLEQVREAFLFHESPHAQDERFFRFGRPWRKGGKINAVVNREDFRGSFPIKRGPQPCRAKLAVGHDEASLSQLKPQPGRADARILVQVFCMSGDTERNAADHARPGGQSRG